MFWVRNRYTGRIIKVYSVRANETDTYFLCNVALRWCWLKANQFDPVEE